MYSREENIVSGNMYRILISLSIPIMINNLIQTLYDLVDGIWVSKLGSTHFAAISFIAPVIFLFTSIGMGLSIAGTSIFARLIGAEKKKEGEEYLKNLLILAIILAFTISIIVFLGSGTIISLMGGTGDIYKYGKTYLSYIAWDMPFTFLFFVYNALMVGGGNTLTPTILSVCGAILNIILDPIFIFIFNLGISGAAIATILSKVIIGLIIIYNFKKNNTPIQLKLNNLRLKKDIVKEIFKISVPSSIGQSGSAIGFIILNRFIVSYGAITMAAFGMGNKITALVSQPAMGIGAALVSVVGQNLGAKKLDRIKEGFHKGVRLALIVSVIGSVIMYFCNASIVSIFVSGESDTRLLEEGVTYLNFILWAMPAMGLFSIFQGYFQGMGKTKYSMYIDIGRLWVFRLPMILIFKNFTNIGSNGIWFAMCFSNYMVLLYGLYVYKRKINLMAEVVGE